MDTSQQFCSNCSKPLPAVGYFCGGCLSQFKCKECGALLEKDYVGCINCGTPKSEQAKTAAQQNTNTFRLHETVNDRIIEATFSDAVGKDLSNILRDAYLSKKGMPSVNLLGNGSSSGDINQLDENINSVQEAEVINGVANDSPQNSTSTAPSEKNQQFQTLKAVAIKNLPSSEAEWIVVYAFYASNFGQDTFTREDIVNRYKESGRYDKSTRKNLTMYMNRAVQGGYINPLTDEFSILGAGIDKAKEIIGRTSSATPRQRTTSKGKKDNNTDEDKNVTPKRASNGGKGLKRLTNIDFEPSGKESLESFLARYSPKSDQERNLLFVFYLQETLGITEITFNHIYTCYDVLDLRVSENLPQTVRNTASRTGWIEIKSAGIRTTIIGNNQIKAWNKKIAK